MEFIDQRNWASGDRGLCYSHNYVDASMVMYEAFEKVFGRAPEVVLDSAAGDRDLGAWNDAWDIAMLDMNPYRYPEAMFHERD